MPGSRINIVTTVLLILCCGISAAQSEKKILLLPATAADCTGAVNLTDSIGPVRSSGGSGKFPEMKNNYGEFPFLMEYEFNPGWYRFTAEDNGLLTLQIRSENAADDYNFALYASPGPWFCNTFVAEQRHNPVRANLSGADAENGITGIAASGTAELADGSSTDPFCKPFRISAGETVYLYIDSRTRPQAGYSVYIRVEKEE